MKNIRKTKQKQLIKEILAETVSHPTADWIYEEARKKLPNISLGTVYRNLNNLKESGEILELNYGSSFSRYDGNPKPHYHFSCTTCGNVYDLDLHLQDGLNDLVQREGFVVEGHRLEFFGTCLACKEIKS